MNTESLAFSDINEKWAKIRRDPCMGKPEKEEEDSREDEFAKDLVPQGTRSR